MIAYYVVLIALALFLIVTFLGMGHIAFVMGSQIIYNFMRMFEGNGAILTILFLIPAAIIWSVFSQKSSNHPNWIRRQGFNGPTETPREPTTIVTENEPLLDQSLAGEAGAQPSTDMTVTPERPEATV